jgi:hypothetical protein
MKKDHTPIEVFGYLFLGLAIGIPAAFYSAWCILKIIEWFKLPFHFTLLQIYATSQIIALYMYKESEDEDFEKVIGEVIKRAVLFSFVLLVMYIIHLIA